MMKSIRNCYFQENDPTHVTILAVWKHFPKVGSWKHIKGFILERNPSNVLSKGKRNIS